MVTFSRSKTNPDAWDLQGSAELLVPGAVVEVNKRSGKNVRKVVGTVLSVSADGKLAVATIHPTLTVKEALKAIKAKAKAKTAPTEPEPEPAAEAPRTERAPVGVRLW